MTDFLRVSGNDYFMSVDTADVKEDLVIGQVHAEDKDQGANGQVKYFLKNPGNTQVSCNFMSWPC